jgi:hypothetical protein
MSGASYPRPKHDGHRTQVAHVDMYGGHTGSQSRCSCGKVGLIRYGWNEANQDSRDHAMVSLGEQS